jgi:hypothetical protein
MKNVAQFTERIVWGAAGLAVSLIILFAILHVLKNQSVPVVGSPVATAANWVGTHASNY